MPDEKPQDTNADNTGNSPHQPGPDSQDWREQRREWREQGREWREQRREERRRDPYRGLFWGLLLIMLGIIFFAWQQGWTSGDQWWHYLLIGLGVIFIINGLVHYWSQNYRQFSYGQFVPGIVLLLVGLAFVVGFSQWWPIVLIGVGVAILLSFIFRKR
jgi:hypothetical protein